MRCDINIESYKSGLGVLFFSWIAFFLIRFFGPIDYDGLDYRLYIFISLFLFFSFVSYSIGYFSGSLCLVEKRISLYKHDDVSNKHEVRLFCALLVATFVYVFVALFDFFVGKSGNIYAITAMRYEGIDDGARGGGVGALLAFLSGAPTMLAALLILMPSPRGLLRRLGVGLVVCGFFCYFLSGGRNSFFIGIVLLFFVRRFFVVIPAKRNSIEEEKKGNKRSLISLFFLFFGICYSVSLFFERAAVRDRNILDIGSHLASTPHVDDVAVIDTGVLFIDNLWSIFVYISFYFTHSFSYLSDYFLVDGSKQFWGAYGMPVFARVFDLLFGTGFFYQTQDSLLVKGSYLSLPGTLYLDFGFLGALIFILMICFLYGWMCSGISRLSILGKIFFAYISAILFFSPMYAAYGIGIGSSIVFLVLIFKVFSVLRGAFS